MMGREQVYFRSDYRFLTDGDRAKQLQQRMDMQDDLRQQIEAKRTRRVRN